MKRVRKLNNKKYEKGDIIYWMSRDQRAEDNWALIHAQKLSRKVRVLFCLVDFPEAQDKHFTFMLQGLKQVYEKLQEKNIPFHLVRGKPPEVIPDFVDEYNIGAVVTDFSPLKIKDRWKSNVAENIDLAFHEVDAHNIVPCWHASPKQEYAAYTFRPKINEKPDEFLVDFPKLRKQEMETEELNWEKILENKSSWNAGPGSAQDVLKEFLDKFDKYPENRNDPNKDSTSNLSPYLHFGQISAQRVALAVRNSQASKKAKEEFLEELIVRKELSDNFCFYNKDYDNFNGFPDWAKKTLDKHRKDKREYVYSLKEFRDAKTHDDLWNAAQKQMVETGKMHGYMRMYWAKKILEWTESPEDAMRIALALNNKYELDGRDPNGYVGVAWSIGGVHDRAWAEREIFGKVRYMSYSGCKRKFDVEEYISRHK